MRLLQGQAHDAFVQFAQLTRHEQGPLTQFSGQIGDCFQDAVRRFVKHQRRALSAQPCQHLPPLPRLAGQEAMKEELLCQKTRGRQGRDCRASAG